MVFIFFGFFSIFFFSNSKDRQKNQVNFFSIVRRHLSIISLPKTSLYIFNISVVAVPFSRLHFSFSKKKLLGYCSLFHCMKITTQPNIATSLSSKFDCSKQTESFIFTQKKSYFQFNIEYKA